MAEEEKKQEETNEASAEDVKTEKDNNDNKNMIPYDRFQQVIEEKNEYKNELEKLKDQLENMEDPEEIKSQYEEKIEELENKSLSKRKEYAIKTEALKEGVRKDALDDFVKVANKEKLKAEDGEIIGVAELMEDMKEKKAYFFEQEDKTNVGKDSNPGGEENPTEEEERKKLEKYFGIT